MGGTSSIEQLELVTQSLLQRNLVPQDPEEEPHEDKESSSASSSSSSSSSSSKPKPPDIKLLKSGEELFNELFSVICTADDIFYAFSFDLLRAVKDAQPDNFHFLIAGLAEKLFSIVFNHQSKPVELHNSVVAITAIRILTRCLVIVQEEPFSPSQDFLWAESEIPPTPDLHPEAAAILKLPLAARIVRVVIEALFLPEFTVHSSALAVEDDEFNGVFRSKLWVSGLGCMSTAPDSTGDHDQTRTEVLRCLLACVSDSLFTSPGQFKYGRSRWLRAACSGSRLCKTLALSIVNATLAHQPVGYLPYSYALDVSAREAFTDVALQVLLVLLDFQDLSHLTSGRGPAARSSGTGLGTGLGSGLGSSRSRSSSVSESASVSGSGPELTGFSARGSTESSSRGVGTTRIGEEAVEESSQLSNQFRNAIASINDGNDLLHLYVELCRLMHVGVLANNTYLPSSVKELSYWQELLLFVWQLIDINPHFLDFALHNFDLMPLLDGILFYTYFSRPQQRVGTKFTGIFSLLRLSAHREFGVSLSQGFDSEKLPLPGLPTFIGSYADLIIIMAYDLILDHRNGARSGSDKAPGPPSKADQSAPAPTRTRTAGEEDALPSVLLTIIANISPYCTKLSLLASTRMVKLLEMFSSPKFLYAKPNNYTFLFLLLDAINNIVQYQYRGNSMFVYAITQNAKLFQKLANLPAPASVVSNNAEPPVVSVAPAILVTSSGTSTSTETSTSTTTTSLSIDTSTSTATTTTVPSSPLVLPNSSTIQEIRWRGPLMASLETTLCLLKYLLAKIDTKANSSYLTETEIMKFIDDTTPVGVLPVPHPLVARRYAPNIANHFFFTSFIWGVCFLRNQHLPLFDGEAVRLFAVTNVDEVSG